MQYVLNRDNANASDKQRCRLGFFGIEFHLMIEDVQLHTIIQDIYKDFCVLPKDAHCHEFAPIEISVNGLNANFNVQKDGSTIFSGLNLAKVLGAVDSIIEVGIHRIKANICDIHASTVAKDGMNVIFVGTSGSGKTTLAAGMSLWQGWSLLGDEYAYCAFDTQTFFQEPYPLRIKDHRNYLFNEQFLKTEWEMQDIYGTCSSPVPIWTIGVSKHRAWVPMNLVVFPCYSPILKSCLIQTLSIAKLHRCIMPSICGAGLDRSALYKELISALSTNNTRLIAMSFGNATTATRELGEWIASNL